MTRDDRAVALVVVGLGLGVWLLDRQSSGSGQRTTGSPVGGQVGTTGSTTAPACVDVPDPLTDPVGYADYIFTGGAPCSQ